MVSCLLLRAALAAAPGFEWRELPGGRLELSEGGKPALIYNYGPQSKAGAAEGQWRASYLYPLYTPAGVIVVDDSPEDHRHHRGVFWAWPVVGQEDLWVMRGVEDRFEKWLEREAGEELARLGVENGWYAGGKKIVRETVRLTAYPVKGRAREIDVAVTLEALGDAVRIAGSHEQGKSYGGVCARFAPRKETKLVTDSGAVKDSDLVRHHWAELEAVYGGKRAALRITSDGSNPGGDPEWCLREYGFVGASYPGQSGVLLEAGKPLTLRYRIRLEDRD